MNNTTTLPFISIVMPTYNRADLLIHQLHAFNNQTVTKDQFEIIIVDDGSNDSTPELLNVWCKKLDNLKVISQKNGGPAKARNSGVKAAKAEYIAFTDDDCIVATDWIYEIQLSFFQHGAIILQGKTTTDREKRTPLTHQIENLEHRNLTVTCNAAIKKSVFEEVGGFSEDFPYAHNEDTELTWKLNQKGEIFFIPSMHVFHPPIKKSFSSQVKRLKYLVSEFTLFKMHPEAYRLNRSKNPWTTIYFEVAVYHFLRNVKFSLGFFKKPHLMITGLVLQIISELYLILLFPTFWKASRK